MMANSVDEPKARNTKRPNVRDTAADAERTHIALPGQLHDSRNRRNTSQPLRGPRGRPRLPLQKEMRTQGDYGQQQHGGIGDSQRSVDRVCQAS